jgi:hypothetical protein
MEETRDFWLSAMHIKGPPVIDQFPDLVQGDSYEPHTRMKSSAVERQRYPIGVDGLEFWFYKAKGMGHRWPSPIQTWSGLWERFGKNNQDIDFADEAWQFFKRHGKRGFESNRKPSGVTERARFVVYRVNDDDERVTMLERRRPDTMPEPRVFEEYLPYGPVAKKSHYLWFPYGENETKAAGMARVRAAVTQIPIPYDMSLAFNEADAPESGTTAPAKGIRIYVFVDKPILMTNDIVDAVALPDEGFGASVRITLSEDAALSLENATNRWLHRRLAILLDGVVQSVSVVMTPIAGRQMRISLAEADPKSTFSAAQSLAQRLRPN